MILTNLIRTAQGAKAEFAISNVKVIDRVLLNGPDDEEEEESDSAGGSRGRF